MHVERESLLAYMTAADEAKDDLEYVLAEYVNVPGMFRYGATHVEWGAEGKVEVYGIHEYRDGDRDTDGHYIPLTILDEAVRTRSQAPVKAWWDAKLAAEREQTRQHIAAKEQAVEQAERELYGKLKAKYEGTSGA